MVPNHAGNVVVLTNWAPCYITRTKLILVIIPTMVTNASEGCIVLCKTLDILYFLILQKHGFKLYARNWNSDTWKHLKTDNNYWYNTVKRKKQWTNLCSVKRENLCHLVASLEMVAYSNIVLFYIYLNYLVIHMSNT